MCYQSLTMHRCCRAEPAPPINCTSMTVLAVALAGRGLSR
jgi:hypothetical protein